jgi:hypothetical protein
MFSGGRLTIGTWLDDFHLFGLEARGFVLGQQTARTTLSSNAAGVPSLGIPFFNNDVQQQDFADVSTPGETVGRVDISLSSQLWGAEANLTCNLYRGQEIAFDLLGGYRYLGLREILQIRTATSPLQGQEVLFDGLGFTAPALITTLDRFVATTNFQGAQLGAHTQWLCGHLALDLTCKLALGDSATSVNVSGSSSLQAGPTLPLRTLPGGLLALPSNSSRITHDDFAVVPAVEAKVSWAIGRHLTLFASYDFLYWSHVVRASEQVNPQLSVGQIPTFAEFGLPALHQPIQPQPVQTSDGFWAQGVGFGIELRF